MNRERCLKLTAHLNETEKKNLLTFLCMEMGYFLTNEQNLPIDMQVDQDGVYELLDWSDK